MLELTGQRTHESARLMLNVCRAIPERLRQDVRELTAMEVPPEDRRRGYATALLLDVCNEADREGKTLMVFVDPFGDIDMGRSQLREWYARFNFLVIQEAPLLMARMPGSSPRQLSPIAQAIGALH